MGRMSSQPGKSRENFPKRGFLVGFIVLGCLATGTALAPGRQVDAGVAGADGGVREPHTVDTRRDVPLNVKAGPPIPAKPEPWMQTAPCRKDSEETIHGSCWVETVKKPPCPPSFFEHRGACFVAVAKTKRPDTSIGQ